MNTKQIFTSKHPLFYRMLGIAPALMLTNRFDVALLGALVFLSLITLSFLANSLYRGESKYGRFVLTLGISSVLITGIEATFFYLNPEIWDSLALPLRLMITSGPLFLLAMPTAKKLSASRALGAGLLESISYTSGILTLALIREVFGSGSLSFPGYSLQIPLLSDFPIVPLATSGGAILLFALLQVFLRKAFPERKMREVIKTKAPAQHGMAPSKKRAPIPSKPSLPVREASPTAEEEKPQGKDASSQEVLGHSDTASSAAGAESAGGEGQKQAGQFDEIPQIMENNTQSSAGEKNLQSSQEEKPQDSLDQVSESSKASEIMGNHEDLPTSPLPSWELLENLSKKAKESGVKVLVMGSGKGMETWGLAIRVLHLGGNDPGMNLRVQGIESHSGFVSSSQGGVFHREEFDFLTLEEKKTYLLRNKDPEKDLVKIVPSLEGMVRFSQGGAEETQIQESEDWELVWIRSPLDLLDEKTIQSLLEKITKNLRPGGTLLAEFPEALGQPVELKPIAHGAWEK